LKTRFSSLTFFLFALITVSCSSTHKSAPAASSSAAASPPAARFSLEPSDWQLLDLAGAPIVPNSKPSLSFFEPGKVAGNASCNRFTGSVTITANNLKFGQLATTMMACADPKISEQESTYLKALAAATRYEWHDPYLHIFCDGFDQPLQFSRAPSSNQ
jgi:heat shock protein HslJ